MKSTYIGLALFCLAVFGMPGIVAAQSKIGFVNTQRIFDESEPAKRASKKLETEFAKREKEVNDLGVRLRTESEKLEKDAPILSPKPSMP